MTPHKATAMPRWTRCRMREARSGDISWVPRRSTHVEVVNAVSAESAELNAEASSPTTKATPSAWAEAATHGHHGVEPVGGLGKGHADLACVHPQHGAHGQEEQVGAHQNDGERPHVPLGLAQVSASEVFLHHVLVKPGHGDGDKHAGQHVFEPVVAHFPVLGDPDLGQVCGSDHLRQVDPAVAAGLKDAADGQDDGQKHAGGLKGVGPNHRAHAAFLGVQVDDGQNPGRRQAKPRPRRGTARQGSSTKTSTTRATRNSRNEAPDDATHNEKPRARFVGVARPNRVPKNR